MSILSLVGWFLLVPLSAILTAMLLFRWILIPLNVSKRRLYARYQYEEELLQNDTIRHEEEYVSIQNRTLYRQTWSPAKGAIQSIVVFIHGLNSYSGKFAQWVPTFTNKGICVVGIDHFGHGRSDGLHGMVPSIRELVEDVEGHIQHLKGRQEFEHVPLFTMGMSMGGLVQLRHSVKYPHSANGMIVMCPLIYPEGGVTPSPLVQSLGHALCSVLPEAVLSKANKDRGFRNPEKKHANDADFRSYHGWMRIGTGISLLEGFTAMQSCLDRVSTPFLLIHGSEDDTVDVRGSRELYEKSSAADKSFIELPGSSHVLTEEPWHISRPMFESIVAWVCTRS